MRYLWCLGKAQQLLFSMFALNINFYFDLFWGCVWICGALTGYLWVWGSGSKSVFGFAHKGE